MTPFQALYSREAPSNPLYSTGNSDIDVVDMNLQMRKNNLHSIKLALGKAQSRMKVVADKHRSNIKFEEGQWVLVKLTPYRQSTMATRLQNKLC